MSTWIKVISVILAVVTMGTIFPAKLEAHSSPAEAIAVTQEADPQLPAPGRNALSIAAGMVNPALGQALNILGQAAGHRQDQVVILQAVGQAPGSRRSVVVSCTAVLFPGGELL